MPSASGTKLPFCLSGISLAAARGAAGVRCGAGLSNMPFSTATDLTTVDISAVTQAVNAAADAGLSKISLLLNLAVKRAQNLANAYNSGVLWPVPNLPWNGCSTALRNWICDVPLQGIVDAAYNAAVAKGKTPSTFLEFELLNEPGKDGNQEPVDFDGTFTTYPGLSNGQIHADYASMLDLVLTRVNFRTVPTISLTLEASGTVEAQAEVDSITGATWTSVIGACTKIGFNRYSDAINPPYVAATAQAALSTKIQAQVTRMAANSAIGSKGKVLRECGILYPTRCPPCTHPNRILNDFITELKAEANISEAGIYTAYNVGGSVGSGDWNFYTYELDNTPRSVAGAQVHLSF